MEQRGRSPRNTRDRNFNLILEECLGNSEAQCREGVKERRRRKGEKSEAH